MIEIIEDEGLRSVIDYWSSKRRGRSMPSRADIDPLDLPGRLWPHLSLIDVVREGAVERFRYRRVGAVFVEAMGRDPTGMFLEDLLKQQGGHLDYIAGLYRDVVAHKKPVYAENLLWRDGELQVHRQTLRLLLPLSPDGARVDMVLVAHVYRYRHHTEKDSGRVREIVESKRVFLEV